MVNNEYIQSLYQENRAFYWKKINELEEDGIC